MSADNTEPPATGTIPFRSAYNAYINRLLSEEDWESPTSPIRLATGIPLAELAGTPFFHNSRLLLKFMVDDGGTDCTATGNINRAFARRMFDAMMMNRLHRESTLRMCKVINEPDVCDLQLLRGVCELGGLLVRRKKRFHATKVAVNLLKEDQAGHLYQRLFITHFRRMDMSYTFPLRNVPGIQATLAAILWRLNSVAREWIGVDKLPELILFPGVRDEMRRVMYPNDSEAWILAGYLLDALRNFGLVETEGDKEWPGVTENDSLRLSALWSNFITFAP